MSKPKRPRIETPSMLLGEQRINKLLAAAGLGSRRQVDELITDGRVEIDGKTVTQVGIKVDAEKVKISVDGEALKRHRPLYFAVHKPAGVLCTNRDPEGRPRVIDLVPGNNRLFPVGRLDASSTGLILLTNDGELAQRLAHPKHSVPKNYFVVVAGQVEMDAMRRLQRGIYLAEGLARVDGAKIRKVRKGCTEIEITLSEGKNREIRRVLARLGHRVVTLRRLAIGPLKLANLPEGSFRPLTSEEVSQLYSVVDDIKRQKKVDRKERDQRRSAEMNGIEPGIVAETQDESSTNTLSADDSLNKKPQRVKKKTKAESKPAPTWEDEADGMLETLPPLSQNPFRQEDDDDNVIDAGYENAILVREQGPVIDAGLKRGKVLGYTEHAEDDELVIPASALKANSPHATDDEEFDDDDDATGMGFETFDDDDESNWDDESDSDDETMGRELDDAPVPANSPWSKSAKKHSRNDRQSNDRSRVTSSRNNRPADVAPRTYQPRRGSGKPASQRREEANTRLAAENSEVRSNERSRSARTSSTGTNSQEGAGSRPGGDRRTAGDRRTTGSRRPTGAGRPTGERSSTGERRQVGERRPSRTGRQVGDRRPTGGRSYGTSSSASRSSSGGRTSSGGRSTGGGRSSGGGRSKPMGSRTGYGGGRSSGPREGAGGEGGRSGARPAGSRPTGSRGGKTTGGPKGRKGGGKGRPPRSRG